MSDETKDLKREVSDVIERRDQAKQYMRANYYDEWSDVFQAIKCRTKPMMRIDGSGKETEDKLRTNVAMPDLSIIHRRNVARLTASPYRLRYTGGDPMVAEMLSSLAIQQYDRSGEQVHDRRLVMSAEAFGVGYSKLYWDTVAPTRVFRKAFMRGDKVIFRDRASVMRYQEAPEEEIKQATQPVEQGGLGPDLSDDEVAQAMGRSGSEIIAPQQITKYEGPCLKNVFVGDFFIEPGVLCLNDSSFAIEQYTETDLWLQRMAKLTYKEAGKEKRVFDPESCQELLDMNPGAEEPDAKISDLKQMFRGAISQTTPRPFEKRLLPHKRFDILEYHALGEDGRMWISWCSDRYRDRPLGKMPYPWDLYGKFNYTEFLPLPDMISHVGDATPRLLRYVYLLKNLTVGQNFDYVTQLLKIFLLRESGVRIEDDVVDRGLFRELVISKLSGIRTEQLPALPAGAFERTAYLRSEMAVAEPSINNIESGTQVSPLAGKTATTAMLASKAADALLQFKVDGRNIYLKEVGEKKLWMNQQAAEDAWELSQDSWSPELAKAHQSGELGKWAEERGGEDKWVLSARYGSTAAIRLDPLEIQEDYGVEPVAGSYLALDDDIRQNAAMRLQAVATANPGIIDQRKLAQFQLSTIPNLPGEPQEYILPQQPPDPGRDMKKTATLSIKFESLPPDVQNALFAELGIQRNPADAQAEQVTHGVQQISAAANAAANLESPVQPNPAMETPQQMPNGQAVNE